MLDVHSVPHAADTWKEFYPDAAAHYIRKHGEKLLHQQRENFFFLLIQSLCVIPLRCRNHRSEALADQSRLDKVLAEVLKYGAIGWRFYGARDQQGARLAAYSAPVAPAVTRISVSGLARIPLNAVSFPAIASRSGAIPSNRV